MSPDGHLTSFSLSDKLGISPFSITNGPDKALWFLVDASTSDIVRITVDGQMKAFRMKAAGSKLQAVTYGNDGNLWFTDAGTNKIGRMSGSGVVREFGVPTSNAGLSGICQGPDGRLWFLEQNANKVGSVTPSGSFKEYDIPTPSSGPNAIVAAPDGALWFTEDPVGKIGRITTAGQIAELTLQGTYPRPYDIAVGSDKNVWFTESESYGIIGRVDLNEVPGSDPTYSEIALSLGNARPQLGVPQNFPLSFAVQDLKHHVIQGQYPNAIHLTSSDPKQASLSETVLKSSTSKASVAFSGHYTDAVISANADGGGSVQTASVLPSAPREKKLPNPGYGLTTGPNDTLWICLADGSIATYSKTGTVKVYKATTSFTGEGCSILEGPDGNVWFTDYANNRIGKITARGQVTFIELGNDASPYSMALGSLELLEGHDITMLPALERLGGSSGGAHPKALIAFNQSTNAIADGAGPIPDGSEAWLVKFRSSRNDLEDSGPLEAAYADMARNAGLSVAPTRLFPGGAYGYFGTRRFDRIAGNGRFHVLSAAAMLEMDWDSGGLDYDRLMRLGRYVVQRHDAAQRLFARMVFNVVANNRDDHAKQHAFLMNAQGVWDLAPSFDLTFARGRGGEHYLAVKGRAADDITRELMVELGREHGIDAAESRSIIERTMDAVNRFEEFTRPYPISASTCQDINRALQSNIARLAGRSIRSSEAQKRPRENVRN